MISIKVVIPVAGYATRLYPLTVNTPKALLKVKGKPILEHIFAKLKDIPDIECVYIVSNSKFFPNFSRWLNSFHPHIPVRLLNDHTTSNEDRLGQIGDIQLVLEKEKINDDLLVIAGDNLFNFSLLPAYRFFRKNNVIVNTVNIVSSLDHARHLGVVQLGLGRLVVDFEEKPAQPKSLLCSNGIYFIPKNKLSVLKEYADAKNPLDKMGYFMKWLVDRRQLYGFANKERGFDIGTLISLKTTEKEFNGKGKYDR